MIKIIEMYNAALYEFEKDDDKNEFKIHLAKSSSTPPEILEVLSNDLEHIRRIVARNPSTPIPILERMAKESNKEYNYFLTQNPSTPEDILKSIYNGKDELIKRFLAANPSTPTNILVELYEDIEYPDRYYILKGLAENSSTPDYILKEIADSGNYHEKLAQNRSTPVSALKKIAIKGNCDIVLAKKLLNSDKQDSDIQESDKQEILDIAKRRVISLWERVEELERIRPPISWEIYSELVSLRITIASNPFTPGDILEKLAIKFDDRIYEALARNTSSPRKVFEKLAETAKIFTHKSIQFNLAMNPSTPEDILEGLAETFKKNKSFKEQIAWRKTTPENILIQLSRDSDIDVKKRSCFK